MVQSVIDHARQTRFSDPGRHRARVESLPVEPVALSAAARNVIAHYRASAADLPPSSRDDIHARWLEDILSIDERRHPEPLEVTRELADRVQGCCRDHTLFCVGVLRAHGVPARSRVGFAGYFVDGWHHDHVIVEAWIGGRWRRFDAEVESPRPALSAPMDIEWDQSSGLGFTTAAQAWSRYRRGDMDLSTFGVDPLVPGLNGPGFAFAEVIHEVAHRFGDELLLWDVWGRMPTPGASVTDDDVRWMDDVVALLLAADTGDLDAERALLERYRADAGLHPGAVITRASPYGEPPIDVVLDRR